MRAAGGGGLAVAAGKVDLRDCTVQGNEAYDPAGGILVFAEARLDIFRWTRIAL